MGSFCFVCGAPGVVAEDTPEAETFVCESGHRSPRAFLFDGRAVFSFEQGRLVHETAGALIRRDGRLLLFLRRKFPLLYTVPAGHVEAGRDPADEMRREVLEETGLTVATAARLWPGETPLLHDSCRRGADLHRWHAFEAEASGQPHLSDEGRSLGWFSPDEVRELAARGLLVAPVHWILSRLGLLAPGAERA